MLFGRDFSQSDILLTMSISRRKSPDDMWVASYKPEKDHIYLGRADAKVAIYLAPHRKGLAVNVYHSGFKTSKTAGTRPRRHIVPGEYSLEDVVQWLYSISGHANGKVGWLRGHWKILREAIDSGRAGAWDGNLDDIPEGWVLSAGAGRLGLPISVPHSQYERFANQILISGFSHYNFPFTKRQFVEFSNQHDGMFLLDENIHLAEERSRLSLPQRQADKRVAQIRAVIVDSGVWERRGRLGWKVPASFFEQVPLKRFLMHSSVSPRSWWKHLLTRSLLPAERNPEDILPEPFIEKPTSRAKLGGPTWKAYEKKFAEIEAGKPERIAQRAALGRKSWREKYSVVSEKMKLGLFPEGLCSIRGWDRMELRDLVAHVKQGHIFAKSWGNWVGHLYPIYGSLFAHHLDWRMSDVDRFDRIVRMLNGLPRVDASAEAMEQCANQGMSVDMLLEFSPRTTSALNRLERLFVRLRNANPRHRTSFLTEEYKPPSVDVPEGWKWADHLDFYELSTMYNCCISNSFAYDRNIIRGRAHVLYRMDLSTPLLAYACWNPDKQAWRIHEQRGMGNRVASPDLVTEAHRIVSLLPAEPGPNLTKPTGAKSVRLNIGRDERERRECELMLRNFGDEAGNLDDLRF